jgi:heat shock protein HslJ
MRRLGAVVVVPSVLALSILGLGGCGRASAGSGGEWPGDRAFYSTAVTKGGRPHDLVPGTRIELRFFEDGRVSAQAGCNHLGGDGRIEGGRLVLGEMSMTEMGCDQARMDQDRWLGGFLGSRPTWALAGVALTLRGGDVEIQLADRDVVDPPRPLAGTRWVVDTIVDGDTASSVPAGRAAVVVFDGRGGVRADTGCFEIAGRAEVTATVIHFSGVGGDPVPCPSPAATTHAAVAGVLDGPVTYRITGPRLTLTGSDGQGLGLRAEA